jgi:hypothetical protein
MNRDQLEQNFLRSGSRHAISPAKKEQIIKLLFLSQFEDIFVMRTKYSDSLCSLIQYKYIEVLSKATNNKFREFGYFVPRTPFKNFYTDEELTQIKIKTYKELLNYYNLILVPMLQGCSEKEAIISINNYKFRKLDDKSHLIK